MTGRGREASPSRFAIVTDADTAITAAEMLASGKLAAYIYVENTPHGLAAEIRVAPGPDAAERMAKLEAMLDRIVRGSGHALVDMDAPRGAA